MARKSNQISSGKPDAKHKNQLQEELEKPWRSRSIKRTQSLMDDLYEVYYFLEKDSRTRLGLMMKVPVFIQDPQVAIDNPQLGIEAIEVRLDAGLFPGPSSSRIVVVDYNADTKKISPPIIWDDTVGWFRHPSVNISSTSGAGQTQEGELLPEPPKLPSKSRKKNPTEADMENRQKFAEFEIKSKEFIRQSVKNGYFHQLNVWAIVQRVLEFYEHPWALGRPVPWGFDGNKLIVVPHAGYGENAFYDQRSKSLQFYYFGDTENPGFTCLSHDIIAHETGHAVLDGIRPLYRQHTSVQTTAFHEFIGDLTAILLALDNADIRHYIAEKTGGKMQNASVLADLAEQFGKDVQGRDYLRSASNKDDMLKYIDSQSPHKVSQVLTGAMFDILIDVAKKHMEKNALAESAETTGTDIQGISDGGENTAETEDGESTDNNAIDGSEPNTVAGGAMVAQGQPSSPVTAKQAFARAAERFRRVAIQPLDLCPPCDIQFVDYARAVLRNDILTNPVDERGYRNAMLDVFHNRKICQCNYLEDRVVDLDCQFFEVLSPYAFKPKIDLVYHDIGRVSRSRTAAYYYLNDNRRAFRIPPNQDITITDLYDNQKLGAVAERLPREVVLEYIWKEEVILKDDQNLSFGKDNGKVVYLYCGGTLVFDERGNILSWLRKPGTQHISLETEANIRQRLLVNKKVTIQEKAELADLDEGRKRQNSLLKHYASIARFGLVEESQPANALSQGLKPIMAIDDGRVLGLEVRPHLRRSDFDSEEQEWTANF